MKTQLYFWKPLMEEYQRELSLVEDYYRRTSAVFEDMEDEAEKYGEQLFENHPATEYTDPASVAEWVEEKKVEKYLTLRLMKSNHLLMTVSMLYQMWEQQLIRFTIREMKHHISFREKEMPFEHVLAIFKLHNVDILKTRAWVKLRELKSLVNTVKHGDGNSADKLRKIRPDFFELDILKESELDTIKKTDTLELYESVFFDEYALQVSESDLYAYVNAAKGFWDEFPERAFSETELLLKELNELSKRKTKKRSPEDS